MLLPGGNSPQFLFNKLINYDINWHDITLLASDDRVVSLSSNNSNTGMIQRELIDQINKKNKPRLIKLYPTKNDDINNGLKSLENYLSKSNPEVAYLGIGRDGHTAGIFKAKKTTKYCYLLKNRIDPYYRVTISMNVLTKIPHLIFFVLGSEKKSFIENILNNKKSKKFEAARFLLINGSGEKTILCDKKAVPNDIGVGELIISL